MPWALVVWTAGSIICLLPLAIGRLSLWRLSRASWRLVGGSWPALAQRAAAAVRLRGGVALLQSAAEPMPMVWGFVRPKLLIPSEADGWPAERRWVVLLHELAHARRRDCLAKLVAHVACAIYWFNPLCWLAFRQMQSEAEAACDDLVLAAGHRPSDYASHLLEIASGLRAGMLAAHSAIAMARRSRLRGRLVAILDGRRNRRALTRLSVLLAAILVAALALPISILKAGADKDPKAASEESPAANAADPANTVHGMLVLDRPIELKAALLHDGRRLLEATNLRFERRGEGGWLAATLGLRCHARLDAVYMARLQLLDANGRAISSYREIFQPAGASKQLWRNGVLELLMYPLVGAERAERFRLSLTAEHLDAPVQPAAAGPASPQAQPPEPAGEAINAPVRFTCRGVVADPEGKPVSGAEVVAMRFYRGHETLGTHYDQVGELVTTGDDGAFAFSTRAMPSTHPWLVIFARKEGRAIGWSRWPRKPGAEVTVQLSEGIWPDGNPICLRGTVVDEAGKAVPAATVVPFLRRDSGGLDIIGLPALKWLVTKTDAEGRFELRGVPADVKAEYLVSAPGRARLFTGSRAEPGRFAPHRDEARIVLPKEGRIEGTIVDKRSGKGVGGVPVVAVMDESMWCLERATCVSAADGAIRLGGLREGMWHLRIACSPTDRTDWVGSAIKAEVKAGRPTEKVRLEVTPGALLEITLVTPDGQPIPNALLSLTNRERQWSRRCQTDGRGSAQVRVMPGTVTVSGRLELASGALWVNQAVAVQEGQTRQLRIGADHQRPQPAAARPASPQAQPAPAPGEVLVMGKVPRPGVYGHSRNRTVRQLLVSAGYEKVQEPVERIYLCREGGGRLMVQWLVDAKRILNGTAPDVELLPGDMLVTENVRESLERQAAAQPAAARPAAPQTQPGAEAGRKQRALAPGDIVDVSVLGLLHEGEEAVFRRQVTDAGTIALPFLDPIEAEGLTQDQLREAIAKAYTEKNILKDPSVSVMTVLFSAFRPGPAAGPGRVRLYRLARARADDAATALREIFRDDPTIKVWADARTNCLLVSAASEKRKPIEAIISELDAPVTTRPAWLEDQRRALLVRLGALRQRFGPNHRTVTELQGQLEQIEKELAAWEMRVEAERAAARAQSRPPEAQPAGGPAYILGKVTRPGPVALPTTLRAAVLAAGCENTEKRMDLYRCGPDGRARWIRRVFLQSLLRGTKDDPALRAGDVIEVGGIGSGEVEVDDPQAFARRLTAFGPAVEVVLSDLDRGGKALIDFDTGEVFSRPAGLEGRAMEEWIAEKGIDASGKIERRDDPPARTMPHSGRPLGPVLGGGVIFYDAVRRPHTGRMDEVKPEQLTGDRGLIGTRKPHQSHERYYARDLPMAPLLLFRTREDGMGILQIVELVAGKGVRIRYRMLRPPKPR